MNTIHKYPLHIIGALQTLRMPQGAEILHVAMQSDAACIWARVDTARPPGDRSFVIRGTGQPIPVSDHRYLGTVHDGAFVWHIFEWTP